MNAAVFASFLLAAAGMIAGSIGMAVVATSSPALQAAPVAFGGNTPVCQPGYVTVNNVCVLENK